MDVPRRLRVDLLSPGELAIWTAHQVLERGPADPLLTEAGELLRLAQERVADFVDRDD